MSVIVINEETVAVVEVAEQGPPGPPGNPGPPGSSDHGALAGLADDDHAQYHNDARGDARYSQIGHGHSAASISDFAATVRATTLSGLAAGANAAIADTDTILAAFAKLQAQIDEFSGMAIGGAIAGATEHSILFAGAGGVLAQNNSAFKWTNNTELLVQTSGESANGAFRLKFAGWTGSAYSTGLVIETTSPASYAATHLKLFDVAYNSTAKISNANGMLGFLVGNNAQNGGGAAFYSSQGSYVAGYWYTGNGAAERVRINAVSAATIGLKIALASSQTGDALSVANNGGTDVFVIDKNGSPGIKVNAAPADGDIDANQLFFWFDPSNGSATLRVKGKTANGTVVAGTLALS